jgi:Ca2+-binding RTX toxin-like protein
VFGGKGDDVIIGSNAANVLKGGEGDDGLTGLRGRDVMTGGDGFDNFWFLSLKDSGTTAKTRDVITDFTQGDDAISFEEIEARLDRVFTFIGTEKFHHNGTGEFRFSFDHGNTIVSLDANGNGKADLTILLKGIHALDSNDFLF